jgi:FKBP-type peptidyl-prolyl cis-trans isomerase FklB
MNEPAPNDGSRVTSRHCARRNASAVIALLGMCLWTCAPAGDNPAVPDTAQQKAGYSAGFEFGDRLARLRNQGSEVELEAVFRGVIDALSGAAPLMSRQQMQATLDGLEATAVGKPTVDVGKEDARLPARVRGFADDFARLNAAREGVVVLPSGVQYEVLEAGSGKKPGADDTVLIHYEGSLTNGVVFDSTREDDKPARLAMKEIVVPGMREAVMLMNEGAKWRVVIPPAMGFGRAGNNMLRKRDLIYEIELLAVESPVKQAPAATGAVNTQGADATP